MRVSRLYVDSPLNVGGRIELDDDAAHYVRSVLRLKQDQAIVVFNGQGGEYLARFSEVSRKAVRVEIESHVARDVESPLAIHLGLGISRGDRMDWAVQKAVELGVDVESPLAIHLGLGISRGDRMDWAVQKAVELGVTQLTPLITERCVIKFNDDKKQQRFDHWHGIIRHAAEQSGRTALPTLHPVSTLAEWAETQGGLRVFLDPYASQSLKQLVPENKQLSLLSGPEGGFSDQERQFALHLGFTAVSMGPRILRTETAVLSALSAAQTLWGDFC